MNTSTWFRPKDLLDRIFEAGIILKGLDGLLEIVGGILLLVLSPAQIHDFVAIITQHELSQDPSDFIANRLLGMTHGLIGAILKNQLWAYPWMIAFLILFIGYQLYRMTLLPSFGLAALTAFDLVIVWLTYREYLKRHG